MASIVVVKTIYKKFQEKSCKTTNQQHFKRVENVFIQKRPVNLIIHNNRMGVCVVIEAGTKYLHIIIIGIYVDKMRILNDRD